MIIIKALAKVLLFPIWLILTALWLVMKAIVSVYSFLRTLIGTGLTLLIIGTAICYQDWIQVIFLGAILGFLFLIMAAGTFIEVVLDNMRQEILDM